MRAQDAPPDLWIRRRFCASLPKKGRTRFIPAIGFLAENLDFIRACEAAGIAFIGPPSAVVVERVSDKLAALERVRAAGLPTVTHRRESYRADDFDALQR